MEPILIFDLDGTILSVNSFPYWARYMLSGYFGSLSATQRLALSLRAGLVLFQRKLLRHSHGLTKRRLQALWAEALEKDAARSALHKLNMRLQDRVRPNMRRLMMAVADRQFDALLATSAARDYAEALGSALGFTHVLASGETENAAERKRDQVLAVIASQGWNDRRRIFFTDHKEDLPLIRQCQRIFWFGKDGEVDTIRANAPLAEVIASRTFSEAELMRRIMQEA